MPAAATPLRVLLAVLLTSVCFVYLRKHTSLQHTSSALSGSAFERLRRRVVAVADLHGDLAHAHNVLRMAGLIDAQAHWSGGSAVLASTGDIVDRGDDTIALYRMFDRLRTEAAAVGGEVSNCIGNHEMMNALHDWRYVTPGDLASFGGPKARRRAMSEAGWIGQTWLANYSITNTIPLLPPQQLSRAKLPASYQVPHASFVHGGITPAWAARGVAHINAVGRSLLLKALKDQSGAFLPPGTTPEEQNLYAEDGPLWYRGYATDPEQLVCKHAEEAARLLGAKHLVMGHTPHFSGFVVRCDASVLLIDTGISRAYGGEQSALIIDTELQHLGHGRWVEKETLQALYKGRLPRIIAETERFIE